MPVLSAKHLRAAVFPAAAAAPAICLCGAGEDEDGVITFSIPGEDDEPIEEGENANA